MAIAAGVLGLLLAALGIFLARRRMLNKARVVQHLCSESAFLVKPYLQLGNNPTRRQSEKLLLVWFTDDDGGQYKVEVRDLTTFGWTRCQVFDREKISVPGSGPIYRHEAELAPLAAGRDFAYRLFRDDELIFSSQGRALSGRGSALRFIITGDLGKGLGREKNIAAQMLAQNPDLIMVVGDVIYMHGLVSEYLRFFFPVYNAEVATADGAPLLRQVPVVTALGNHDTAALDSRIDSRDPDRFPDMLGYFLFWSLPRNGPTLPAEMHFDGSPEAIARVKNMVGKRYPVMANYSFDHGDAHFVVLDGNAYMDWQDKGLRSWLEDDLAAARNSRWKFVFCHQPPFTSDPKHFLEQRMRLVVDILQRHGVDLVFAGHSHRYELCYPLRFFADRTSDGKFVYKDGLVPGDMEIDEQFGKMRNIPDGIIHIVTGAGGAKLTAVDRTNPGLKAFTTRAVGDVHSYTLCELNGDVLKVSQLAADRRVIDEFTVEKENI